MQRHYECLAATSQLPWCTVPWSFRRPSTFFLHSFFCICISVFCLVSLPFFCIHIFYSTSFPCFSPWIHSSHLLLGAPPLVFLHLHLFFLCPLALPCPRCSLPLLSLLLAYLSCGVVPRSYFRCCLSLVLVLSLVLSLVLNQVSSLDDGHALVLSFDVVSPFPFPT